LWAPPLSPCIFFPSSVHSPPPTHPLTRSPVAHVLLSPPFLVFRIFFFGLRVCFCGYLSPGPIFRHVLSVSSSGAGHSRFPFGRFFPLDGVFSRVRPFPPLSPVLWTQSVGSYQNSVQSHPTYFFFLNHLRQHPYPAFPSFPSHFPHLTQSYASFFPLLLFPLRAPFPFAVRAPFFSQLTESLFEETSPLKSPPDYVPMYFLSLHNSYPTSSTATFF